MSNFLFVIDHLGSGGAQRQMITLAKSIVDQGHSVEFMIYHPSHNHFSYLLEDTEIVIHEYHKKSRFDPRVPFFLANLIRKNNYTAALAFLHTPAFYLELASIFIKFSRKRKPKILVSERFSYFDNQKLSIKFRLQQQLHRFSDQIIVNSHHQIEKMIICFPWMKGKLTTIYNGIEIDNFQRTAAYDSDADSFLLCVSRVVEYKNYARLAEAIIIYRNTWGTPPKIKWVGKVTDTESNNTQLKNTINQLKQEGLDKQIEFLGEQKDVESYYDNASAMIHPSLIEGFSNAIIEGMSYGLPVLLGDVCDHNRLISESENGILFDPRNPSSIAMVIRKYMTSSPTEKQIWSSNSIIATHKLFSLESSTDSYLKVMART